MRRPRSSPLLTNGITVRDSPQTEFCNTIGAEADRGFGEADFGFPALGIVCTAPRFPEIFLQPAAAIVGPPPRSKFGVVGKNLPAPRPMPCQRQRTAAR